MKYNSCVFLGFSVDHSTKDPYKSITADQLRQAIIQKLADCPNDDLLDNIEITDTYEEGEDG